uniref:BRO1 domain-containing protein n=1 Tax=Ditylenchus dipsaci TaxID=166011 RepID=A0A915CLV4_9BILA
MHLVAHLTGYTMTAQKLITNDSAAKICSELRLRRAPFLEHLQSARLLYGFVFEIDQPGRQYQDYDQPREKRNSKLRYLQRFIWANSMFGSEAVEIGDVWFEVLNICINLALWYMKRAAWISAKDDVREPDAKQIHTALRRAAGIFEFVKLNTDKLNGMYQFPGNDLESNVLDAYANQCTAEAQEVTIARAIELKHAPKLISSLATETAHKYELCDKLIEKENPANFEKWRFYFQLKQQFYLAYAYAYLGESLLLEDKCGEAVRACKEGITSYQLAEELCVKYANARGPGFLAKPEKHLFFRRIQPLLNRHLEKAERENDFIYHQKVPNEIPLLEDKAMYGLAKSEVFTYPAPAENWSSASYTAFDLTKAMMPDFGKAKKAKALPMVKEEKVYETDKDPTNTRSNACFTLFSITYASRNFSAGFPPTCSSTMSNASSSSEIEVLSVNQQQKIALDSQNTDPQKLEQLFDIGLDTIITHANDEEKRHFESSLKAKKLPEKRNFFHCRMFLKNFYPASSYSAAKGMVVCLRDAGLISNELYEVILREHMMLGRLNNAAPNNTAARAIKEKTTQLDFSKDFQWLYSKRVTDAFIELVNKESFPAEFKEGTSSDEQFQKQLRLLIFNFQQLKPKFGETSEERKRGLATEAAKNCDSPTTTAQAQNSTESPNKRLKPTPPFLDYRNPAGRTVREVSPDPDDIVDDVVELQPSNPVKVGAVNPGAFVQQESASNAEVTKTPAQAPVPFTFASVSKQPGPAVANPPACSAQLSTLPRPTPASSNNTEKSPAKTGTPIWRSPANFNFAVAASHNTPVTLNTSISPALPPPKPPVFDLSDEEMPAVEQSKDDEILILPHVRPVPQMENEVIEIATSPVRAGRSRPGNSSSLEKVCSPTTKRLQSSSVQALQAFNAGDVSDGEELFAVFSNTPNTNPSTEKRHQANSKNVRPTSPTTTTNLMVYSKTVNRAAPALVTNGGTATSSSSNSSTQLCDPSANGPSGKGFNWREKYGVWPDRNFALIYNNIAEYREKFKKEFNTFNKGIWNHLMNNLQNDETFAWKMRIRKELQNALCEISPQCNLIAVGSTINGCGAYNCDMDLCLCLPCPLRQYATERSYALSHLKRFRKRLMRLQVVKRVEYIPAKVPILKLWFNQPYEQLEVDLNVNNMPGIFNSYLLHYYSRIDDKFPALCLLVKHWAKRADINEASQGTFNSYSLILMVLHFLQVATDPPILPNLQKLYPDFFSAHLQLSDIKIFSELPTPLPEAPRNTRSVGELLIAFFDYYVNFDYENVAISIARGKTFPRSELLRNTDRFKIFIEEPFDFQNTARCVTGNDEWELITDAFVEARNAFLNSNYPCPPSLQLLKIPPVF